MGLQINERRISPISVLDNGIQRDANIFRLDNFSNYNFSGSGGFVHWVLLESKLIDEVEVKFQLSEGHIELPSELVSDWGIDDQPVFDYVMQQNNVTPI